MAQQCGCMRQSQPTPVQDDIRGGSARETCKGPLCNIISSERGIKRIRMLFLVEQTCPRWMCASIHHALGAKLMPARSTLHPLRFPDMEHAAMAPWPGLADGSVAGHCCETTHHPARHLLHLSTCQPGESALYSATDGRPAGRLIKRP